MSLEFKVLKFLCSPVSREAAAKGLQDLYYTDAVKFYVSGLPDADVASLRVDIHTETSPAGLLAYAAPDGGTPAFMEVTNTPGSFYCTLDLDTSEISDYMTDQAQQPGVPVPVHVIVSDANGVWADVAMNLYHTPGAAASSTPPLSDDPFVRDSELTAALGDYLLSADSVDKAVLNASMTDAQALPTANAAQFEAKLDAVIAAIISATA